MENPNNYAVLDLGEPLTRYHESFHHLGPDEHHPAKSGGRTRRLAQYHATYDHRTKSVDITRLRTQLYVQGKTNKVFGAVAREFQDVEDDLTSFMELGFHLLDQTWSLADYESEHQSEWLIHCHEIRVHTDVGMTGVPVPEGVHKDGAEFVLMGCVAREGVKGGISHVYDSEDGSPIFAVTLMPGQAILVDDRKVFHMVSPLIAKNGHGYRDVILMGFHRWSDGKYPGDWRLNIAKTR